MSKEMQTRRLQISGGSTYMVSIPKEWIERMGMRAGDHVTMMKNANMSITILGNEERSMENASIATNQNDTQDSIRRKIIAAYLRGYKIVNVKSRGTMIQSGHARAIRELVRTSMIGTEIVESSSNSITIQVLAKLPELSFEMALRRMYLMAANMHAEAIESLANSDIPHSEEVVNMDDEVDRFGLYMRRNLVMGMDNTRMLSEMGLKKASDCLGYRAVITRIERIADHAVLIAKRVKFAEGGLEPRMARHIRDLGAATMDAFASAVSALERRDYEGAEKTISDIQNVIEREKGIMASVKDTTKNAMVTRFVLEDIRRAAEYSGDIAEVIIDENIDSVIE